MKIILILFFTSILIFSQSQVDDYSNWTGGFPISKISPKIKLKDNSISLYSDFANIDSSFIPIYIINNTDTTIHFSGDDLALLQQEHKTLDSNWERSNPYFYGWCGTQYDYNIVIDPHCFVLLQEHINQNGNPTKIRFNLLNSKVLPSNVGNGFNIKEEIEKAKYDDISMQLNGCKFLISIIKDYNKINLSNGKRYEIVQRAAYKLYRRCPEQALLLFTELSNDSTYKNRNIFKRKLQLLKEKQNNNFYYSAVEEMPKPLSDLDSIKVYSCHNSREKGKVFLKAYLTEEGIVKKADFIKGNGNFCKEIAISRILNTKFHPGKHRGKPAKVKFTIVVYFGY